MDKVRLEAEGYAIVERTARNGGHSARVFVPISWANKRVYVVLRDPVEEPATSDE